MKSKNKYYLTIALLSILSICQAQKTIDDIETYLFSEIFKSNNSIDEFIELNEENDTIRYWAFDENGKLTKEIDFRNNSWSASIGDQITHKSTTYKTEIIYKYNQDGQINNYVETKILDENILSTIHEFKYPTKDTIIETFKINKDRIQMDCEIIKNNEDSNLKGIVQIIKNYIGTNYVQTNQRIEFLYEHGNKLKKRNQYFTVNSYSENVEPEIMDEVLGATSNYKYDKIGRLKNIHEVEYDEEGFPRLRKDVKFKYKRKTERIKNIEIIYGENYNPNFVKYTMKYNQNGDLKNIKVNDSYFNYVIKQ